MNWRRRHTRAGACLVRVVIVMLVAALAGSSLLLFYRDYVLAGGNESVTRQFSPSAEAANTTDGNTDGFETTPTNAYADDTSYAVDANSGLADNLDPIGTGTDKHNYYNYGLAVIPSGSTISGITVRADIAVDDTKDSPFTAIRLSWDGGTTWTDPVKQFTLTGTAETTYTYGGISDTWGRSWTTSELSDANFRVQVINGDTKAANSIRDFSLDWIPVSITFTAPWDSYNDVGHLVMSDNFTESTNHVYMKGTGFASGNYTVGYYDGDGSWVLVALDENIAVGASGNLTSEYILTTDPEAVGDGWWHALVQPASGYDSLPATYDTAMLDHDLYGLLANDSFYVAQSAIPEFPTIMAAIMVVGLCFGIYYWMRKRRLAYVEV